MSLLNNWFTPTTQALGLLAQNKLLKRYVRSPFEVKSSAALNYIVVKGKAKTDDKIQPWNRKERVLVLMHGFGLGLGFFYGKNLGIDACNTIVTNVYLFYCVY